MMICGRPPKIGQKFLFSAIFLPFFIFSLESKNYQIWRKIWLSMWLEVRNFGRIWKKNFPGQNMMSCGRPLKIGRKFLFPAIFCSFYKFLTFSILGHFSPKWTKILTFKVAGGLKVSANHKKNFLPAKIWWFVAGHRKSARNFYFRPYFGHI